MAFFGAGNVIQGGNFFTGGANPAAAWSTSSGIALHGVVGCVTSVASGGKCGPGALSAAFSHAFAPTTMEISQGNRLVGTLISAIVGGTGSVLGGGKFANGAVTGAFSYLYNCGAHPGSCMRSPSDPAANTSRYHQYELDFGICGFSNPSCTMEDAMATGVRFTTPEADGTRTIRTGDNSVAEVPTFMGDIPIGRVTHVVDYQNNAIFNITLTDHLLAPGYVYLNFYSTDNGIRLRLYGEGNGYFPETNQSRAPQTWGPVVERIRKSIDSQGHGQ